MTPRPGDVARLADAPLDQVWPATAETVRLAYADRVPAEVLEAACSGIGENGEPCYYWRVGLVYYLDDATFGDVVDIGKLKYDKTLGLYSQ